MQISRSHVLAGGLLAITLLAGTWAWSSRVSTTVPTVPAEALPEARPQSESTNEAPARTRVASEISVPTALTKSAEPVSTAILIVDGTRYALTAPAGSILKDALDRLQAESDFNYQYRDYAGLDAFVTHINGRASMGDYVWILYVNGEKSATGISSTRIRSGDVIEWKLEESY